MPSLIRSCVWRDGGSISAVVLDAEQHKSFWLETNDWTNPRDAGHDNLFVSDGDNPSLKENKIPISSADERQWLDYLARVDCDAAGKDSKEQFQTMIRVLRMRQKDSQ